MKRIIVIALLCFSLMSMEERIKNVESINLHLEEWYETARKEYGALSPEIKKVNLECADVMTMLGKLQYELKEKNGEKSLEWFSRFKARTQIDSEWLTNKQKIMLADLFIDLELKVMEIQPESIRKGDRKKLFDVEEYDATSWLFHIVQSKKCSGLEWRASLADSTAENRYLLPKMLYEKRLKKIILLYKSGKYGDDFAQELKQFDIK